MIYAEFALVAWAARRLKRPVKWTADRHEVFLTDYQGRDLAVTAELALDAEGNFLAMRAVARSGAKPCAPRLFILPCGAQQSGGGGPPAGRWRGPAGTNCAVFYRKLGVEIFAMPDTSGIL